MKKTVIALILMAYALCAVAQPSYSSYDTIQAYNRNYHYTEWYTDCPAYKNGGLLDSCFFELYGPTKLHMLAKYEYVDHPISVKGLAAIVNMQMFDIGNRTYKSPSLGEPYLYLLKRIDYVDTVFPDPPQAVYVHPYRMKILDSVRFDTVKPKLMAIPQAFPGAGNLYAYSYEVYFNNPITVDSDFYIYASYSNSFDPVTNSYEHWPYGYASINPVTRSLGCQGPLPSPENCHTKGSYNTMIYTGHDSRTSFGYPALNADEVWCESDFHFPDDPYGLFFAITDHYELQLFSDNLTMGRTEGAGYYYENDVAECTALPNPGYGFSHWNDGSTENPRSLLITQDTALTAYFSEADNMYVHLASNNSDWGTVQGEGDYLANSVVTISATPNGDRYRFTHWDDGNTENPRTFLLTCDTSFTAFFEEVPEYYVRLESNNPLWGTVEGEGYYLEGSTATISAVAADTLYRFVQWSDGDHHRVRSVKVTQDTAFTAIFESRLAVEPASDRVDFTIVPNPANDRITVTVPCDGEYGIEILDVYGRTVLAGTYAEPELTLDISRLPSGYYLLTVSTPRAKSSKGFVKSGQ